MGGEFRKRDFKLLADVAHARELVGDAKDRLLAAVDTRKESAGASVAAGAQG